MTNFILNFLLYLNVVEASEPIQDTNHAQQAAKPNEAVILPKIIIKVPEFPVNPKRVIDIKELDAISGLMLLNRQNEKKK